jgi:hypothetical protein
VGSDKGYRKMSKIIVTITKENGEPLDRMMIDVPDPWMASTNIFEDLSLKYGNSVEEII